ncbi:cystathionine beta-lyase [Acuticoccus sp. MNP-M23]|uniref:cystathionine beta-lyase n=1 Tax=Acuticoccus sp. MNP-M23 TaxID=3072793 RepID=UPI0028158F93|nr:cystathionine beta-lyase [Acuticoccus sp. MNP-M23]WMS42954.1 cystathionine beta-lyase [Acuticoccus sp. MNP-M23]
MYKKPADAHQAKLAPATRIAHGGLDPSAFHGFVNPPVVHASTVLYPDIQGTIDRTQPYTYGSSGTPTTDALRALVLELEEAEDCVLTPTGRAANACALAALVKPGDHVIVLDNVYFPTRKFCDGFLTRFGVTTTYVDPLDHGAVAAALEMPTAVVFLEAPGSQTFEVPDIPHLATMAREAGATTIMDNTWATPLYFQPIAHGIDISIQSATKYFGGHSDLLMGTVSGNGEPMAKVRAAWQDLGLHVGPEDVFLTMRGIRTLDVRMERHARNARIVSEWLSGNPLVHRVLYPALPGAPGHEMWKRDFKGASGLLGITFKDRTREEVIRFIDGLALFGIGYSWGGFESLATLAPMPSLRSATTWPEDEAVVRLHIGLEDPGDLIADLDNSLKAAFAA